MTILELIKWKAILEGLLFVAGDEGLSLKQIALVLDVDQQVAVDIVRDLMEDYEQESRGIYLIEIAGTYQLTTKKIHSEYLKKLVEVPTHSTLSQAALETLAIIAYRQPITRTEIEDIRGVKTERPLQKLVAKALIKEVGRAEGTGRAILYGTTREFLEYFGLKTIAELPPLPEKMDDDNLQDEADLFFENFQNSLED